MKLYFRRTMWYDYTRSDCNEVSYEYSLTPYDKSDTPSRGFYDYCEFELPDSFSKEMALDAAEAMMRNLYGNGVSLSNTLAEIISEAEAKGRKNKL